MWRSCCKRNLPKVPSNQGYPPRSGSLAANFPAITFALGKWWPDPDSNQGHVNFQSTALPTELSGLCEACHPRGRGGSKSDTAGFDNGKIKDCEFLSPRDRARSFLAENHRIAVNFQRRTSINGRPAHTQGNPEKAAEMLSWNEAASIEGFARSQTHRSRCLIAHRTHPLQRESGAFPEVGRIVTRHGFQGKSMPIP